MDTPQDLFRERWGFSVPCAALPYGGFFVSEHSGKWYAEPRESNEIIKADSWEILQERMKLYRAHGC